MSQSIQLKIENGPVTGQVVTTTAGQKLIAGRDSSATLYISDPKLSRHHFRVDRRGHLWHIHDLGSKNGTLVNGKAIDECRLQDGDQILAGNTIISVSIPG